MSNPILSNFPCANAAAPNGHVLHPWEEFWVPEASSRKENICFLTLEQINTALICLFIPALTSYTCAKSEWNQVAGSRLRNFSLLSPILVLGQLHMSQAIYTACSSGQAMLYTTSCLLQQP